MAYFVYAKHHYGGEREDDPVMVNIDQAIRIFFDKAQHDPTKVIMQGYWRGLGSWMDVDAPAAEGCLNYILANSGLKPEDIDPRVWVE